MNHFSNDFTAQSEVALETAVATRLLPPARGGPAENLNSRLMDGWFRRQLLHRLSDLKQSAVTVNEPDGKQTRLGSENSLLNLEDSASDPLEADVFVRESRFFRRVLLGGSMGAAESYIDGDWSIGPNTDELTDLIRVMIRNLNQLNLLEKTWARGKRMVEYLGHRLRPNSMQGSRRNIQAHYDLGNDFYQLFLDSTMNYSAGVFASNEIKFGPSALTVDSLFNSSIRKMDRIGCKLQIRPRDHVLEIGTGWGGLALHLARNFGCRVTTTTISQQQYEYAAAAVHAAGLADQVTVLQSDYRQLTGSYDKIVSVEMIEAVGHQYYDCFFAQCQRLLRKNGLMLLQAITMGEQDYPQHIRQVDFIRRYVFPGGCLPSIGALQRSMGKVTDMRLLHTEDITPHYALTLKCWRDNFMRRLVDVRRLGFDERFIRLWQFYLCYCEAAFAERRVHNVHLVFGRPGSEVDPAVDYRLSETE